MFWNQNRFIALIAHESYKFKLDWYSGGFDEIVWCFVVTKRVQLLLKMMNHDLVLSILPIPILIDYFILCNHGLLTLLFKPPLSALLGWNSGLPSWGTCVIGNIPKKDLVFVSLSCTKLFLNKLLLL